MPVDVRHEDKASSVLPFSAFLARRVVQRTPIPLRQDDLLAWLFQRGVVARLHCEHGTYRVHVAVDPDRGLALWSSEEDVVGSGHERCTSSSSSASGRGDHVTSTSPTRPPRLQGGGSRGRTATPVQHEEGDALSLAIPWADVASTSVECYLRNAAVDEDVHRADCDAAQTNDVPPQGSSDNDDEVEGAAAVGPPSALRTFFCVETTAGEVLLLLPLRIPRQATDRLQWLRGMEGLDVAHATRSVLDGNVWVQRITHSCHLWLAGSQRGDGGGGLGAYAARHSTPVQRGVAASLMGQLQSSDVVHEQPIARQRFVDPMASVAAASPPHPSEAMGGDASMLWARGAGDEPVPGGPTAQGDYSVVDDAPDAGGLAQQLADLRDAIAAKQRLVQRLQTELQRRIDVGADAEFAGAAVLGRPQTAGGVLLAAAAQEADDALIALPRTPTYSPVDDSEADDADDADVAGSAPLAAAASPGGTNSWQREHRPDSSDSQSDERARLGHSHDDDMVVAPAEQAPRGDERATLPMPVTAALISPAASQVPHGYSVEERTEHRGVAWGVGSQRSQQPAEVLLSISPIRNGPVRSMGIECMSAAVPRQSSAPVQRQPPTRGVRVERSDQEIHGNRGGQRRPVRRAAVGERYPTSRQLGLGSIESPVRRREDVAHDPVLLRAFEEIRGGSSTSDSD